MTRLPCLPRHMVLINAGKPPVQRCIFTYISQCAQPWFALAVCRKFHCSVPCCLILLSFNQTTKQSVTYLWADFSKVSLNLLWLFKKRVFIGNNCRRLFTTAGMKSFNALFWSRRSRKWGFYAQIVIRNQYKELKPYFVFYWMFSENVSCVLLTLPTASVCLRIKILLRFTFRLSCNQLQSLTLLAPWL